MKQVLRLCGAAALAMAAVSAGSPAVAAPAGVPVFGANVIFGDSLSDNGNLADGLMHNFPSPPFYHDSFTNGKVGVQVLDDRLGLSTNPSLYYTSGKDVFNLGLATGSNYAVAGATAANTGIGGVPGGNLVYQVGSYLTSVAGKASSSNLYTFFIGGNDVRAAAYNGNASLATTGVATELAFIAQVIASGATNLLVVNVPNIGVIPEAATKTADVRAAATAYTLAYNDALLNGLTLTADLVLTPAVTLPKGTVLPGVKALKATPGTSITYFDLYGFQKGLLDNPGLYGITDTTTPCYLDYGGANTAYKTPVTSTACAAGGDPAGNINHLAFWDAIHPTATVQAAIGNAMADAVIASSVPEPANWATLLVGFGLAGGGLRHRRRRARPVAPAA